MKEDKYDKEVIEPGDLASKIAREVNLGSFGNNQAVEVIDEGGDFRGDVSYVWAPHILELMMQRDPVSKKPLMRETQQTDGAGHKPSFPSFFLKDEAAFFDAAWEIIVMCDHDILRKGGFPVLMTNFMDIKVISKENLDKIKALWQGFDEALFASKLVSITGESAVMKYGVTNFCDLNSPEQLVLNWAGNCTGLHHQEKFLDGSGVRPGMPIVGLHDPSMGCNGATFFIDLILYLFGPEIKRVMDNSKARELLELLNSPSVSYSKTIKRVHGWNDDGSIKEPLAKICGLYHITGGGIWGKFKLPPGVGAHLTRMFEPSEPWLKAQLMSVDTPYEKSDWRAYQSSHGGCRMLGVLETEKDAEIFIEEAKKDGIKAKIVGDTTESAKNEIIIDSKFIYGGSLTSLYPC